MRLLALALAFLLSPAFADEGFFREKLMSCSRDPVRNMLVCTNTGRLPPYVPACSPVEKLVCVGSACTCEPVRCVAVVEWASNDFQHPAITVTPESACLLSKDWALQAAP